MTNANTTLSVLYTSTQVEGADRRAKLTADVLAVLAGGYGLRILGNLPGRSTLYIQAGYEGQYAMWSICDNGGEFNVGPVNKDDECRSVAYLGSLCGVVDALTVAYRIAMVIKGDEIDWSYDASDTDLMAICHEIAAERAA